MKILNRDVSRYTRRIPEIHKYAWYVLMCLVLFKNPLRFLRAYFAKTSIPGGVIELRDGLRIALSSHPDDVVTVFVIIVRRDYGPIAPGSLVVDIGANIGVFALYAARSGARTVLAYEPNTESFQRLQQNITANHLESVIHPFHYAVTGHAGDAVRFPVQPSAYNAIASPEYAGDVELVETTSLPAIAQSLDAIDLLKLDCEGAEYDIVTPAAEQALRKVRAMRMEYHLGRAADMISFLGRLGFAVRLSRADTGTSGSLWFERG